MRPTRELKRAAGQALEDWLTWETFDHSFPYRGGLEDQEAEWVEAIQCVTAASNRAKREIERENHEIQQAQAEAARKKQNKK